MFPVYYLRSFGTSIDDSLVNKDTCECCHGMKKKSGIFFSFVKFALKLKLLHLSLEVWNENVAF